jgi:hypothetical protein
MKKIKFCHLLVALSLVPRLYPQVAPSVAPGAPITVPYCQLVSAERSYDGMAVLTEALVRSDPHEIIVSDPPCPSTPTETHSTSMHLPDGWAKTKLGRELSNIFRKRETARVKFVAIFRAGGQIYGPEHTRFRLDLLEIRSVSRMPGKVPSSRE